jgi:hypothetical protein
MRPRLVTELVRKWRADIADIDWCNICQSGSPKAELLEPLDSDR